VPGLLDGRWPRPACVLPSARVTPGSLFVTLAAQPELARALPSHADAGGRQHRRPERPAGRPWWAPARAIRRDEATHCAACGHARAGLCRVPQGSRGLSWAAAGARRAQVRPV